MKGMIFTEFLEMVEEQFSLDMVDTIINDANVPSGGTYTAVGIYPHSEMVQLVVSLGAKCAIPVPALLNAFGERLFARIAVRYADLLTKATSSFAFLEQLESYVHTEVRKLYPETEQAVATTAPAVNSNGAATADPNSSTAAVVAAPIAAPVIAASTAPTMVMSSAGGLPGTPTTINFDDPVVSAQRWRPLSGGWAIKDGIYSQQRTIHRGQRECARDSARTARSNSSRAARCRGGRATAPTRSTLQQQAADLSAGPDPPAGAE